MYTTAQDGRLDPLPNRSPKSPPVFREFTPGLPGTGAPAFPNSTTIIKKTATEFVAKVRGGGGGFVNVDSTKQKDQPHRRNLAPGAGTLMHRQAINASGGPPPRWKESAKKGSAAANLHRLDQLNKREGAVPKVKKT
mmetsp:Transcript_10636/g.20178  ORF Transcript_10636/g.20178 Transcript_10636/m.20178 type:complete len:137 (-) Transcript_10636:2539-2949(-)